MFNHVMLGVNDLEVSKKFYDALLGTLGIGPGGANKKRYFYSSPTGTSCEDPPGFRELSMGQVYLAYVRDPDGNKICAVHRPAK